MSCRNKFSIGKVFIQATDLENVIEEIEKLVKNGNNEYICVSNPRTVVYANKHIDYLDVMNNSYMNIPDAEPIIWAARLWGLKKVQRTMGPIVFEKMINNPENQIKHFLLGDTQDTLDSILKKSINNYNALIVGSYSPPFCNINEYDYKKIADLINRSGADIVWIALRAPKQDFFASNIIKYLDSKICIGVGAAFRFYLGEYKMSNPIVKKLGLMGLFWGKKNQTFFSFLRGYFSDNVPYLFLLAKIPFKRLRGKKYYEM
ncbi:MAG TPA: WecB/TagA/CpsF family glycosyltransferase [Bacteroidales bacterium]|nr:WecB/TagA/CpsF family glycosyltransferase [Bacteroidales bacterium]